jgi:hypothetical protein
MRARGQTDNDHASFRIPKSGKGLTPVCFLPISPAANPPNFLAVRHQPGT